MKSKFESQRHARAIRGPIIKPLVLSEKKYSQAVSLMNSLTDDLFLANMAMARSFKIRMSEQSDEENLRQARSGFNDPTLQGVHPIDFDDTMLNLERLYSDGSILHFQLSSSTGLNTPIFPARQITVSEMDDANTMVDQYDYSLRDGEVIREHGYSERRRLVSIKEMRRLGAEILHAVCVPFDDCN